MILKKKQAVQIPFSKHVVIIGVMRRTCYACQPVNKHTNITITTKPVLDFVFHVVCIQFCPPIVLCTDLSRITTEMWEIPSFHRRMAK